MKKNAAKGSMRFLIFMGLLTLLEIACMIGAYLLHYLSNRKVGINHHVIIKKQQYLQTFLDCDHITAYQVVIVLMLLAVLIYGFRRFRQFLPKALLSFIFIGVVLLLELSFPLIMDIPIYVYLLALTAIIWLTEFLKLLVIIKRAS